MNAAAQRSTLTIPIAGDPSQWPLARASCFLKCSSSRTTRRSLPGLRASAVSRPSDRREELNRESNFVDVIGIGSRKETLIDFFMESPSTAASGFRFWTINEADSLKVQLLQWCTGKDPELINMQLPLTVQPFPGGFILVASAGHDDDHIVAIELLNAVKSMGGFTAAIVLKPFIFEGQRRQQKVDLLVSKLRELSFFYVVVEADSLLKAEAGTLAEALENADNAVFLSMITIFVLMSDLHMKLLDTAGGKIMRIRPSEALSLLEVHGEARVGFGSGYNIEAAVTQAAFQCPFLEGHIKDLEGVVIITLASSSPLEESDHLGFLQAFRRITKCTSDVIFCRVHEPGMEKKLIVTTLLILGSHKERSISKNRTVLSGLATLFPFLSSLLGREMRKSKSNPSSPNPKIDIDVQHLSKNLDLPNPTDALECEHSKKPQKLYGLEATVNSFSKSHVLRSENILQKPKFGDEECTKCSTTPGYHIAQPCVKQRASITGASKFDHLHFSIPVGVKSSNKCSDQPLYSSSVTLEGGIDRGNMFISNVPDKDMLNSIDFENMDLNNASHKLSMVRDSDNSRKERPLSSRAISMLETERDKQKFWSPELEMEYRGGIYRGQCQDGVPEGKGRLTFSDEGFYDGMWHHGKRSGFGSLHYNNGDVFQGFWRDDLMHGKGWFYFHSGDRWFANFWKGKAIGEGRFYSTDGSLFFGDFKNGWRHGMCLSVDANGTRWTETWNNGILVHRTREEDTEHKFISS